MEKTFEEKINEEIIKYKTNWNNKIYSAYRLSDFDIRQIFATVHEVGLQRDENNYPIFGTGRIITNEEKKAIFDYILENNYPLTRKVYNIVLHAYLNSEIELNIVKTQKL